MCLISFPNFICTFAYFPEGELMDCDGKSESSPEREAVDDETKGLEGAEGVKKRKRRPYRPGTPPALSARSHLASVAPRASVIVGY